MKEEMKERLFYLHIVVFLFSCSTNEKRIETETISFEVLTDSIHSRMPGTLLVLDDYLVWEDAFSFDNFMNVVDLSTGFGIRSIGELGQGPEEFNTPVISKTYDDRIFVFDLNTRHQAYYCLDMIDNPQKIYLKHTDNHQQKITGKIQIDENKFVVLQPSENQMFKFIWENDSIEFGESVIAEKAVSNLYDINQGVMHYNNEEKKLVFASFLFPFIDIYNLESNIVTSVFRNQIKGDLYSRSGDLIKKDTKKTGNMDITLSKDYVITIQRDYENDKTDESSVGMDFNKLPKTLFLYDYSGNLKRIVDVGIPVFRVGSNTKDNTVYAIGVNPDFMIVKIEL